ncbi:MAG: hypothetical protein WA393_02915, partial [Nitrososphaeraceae archaeon]
IYLQFCDGLVFEVIAIRNSSVNMNKTAGPIALNVITSQDILCYEKMELEPKDYDDWRRCPSCGMFIINL